MTYIYFKCQVRSYVLKNSNTNLIPYTRNRVRILILRQKPSFGKVVRFIRNFYTHTLQQNIVIRAYIGDNELEIVSNKSR